MIKFVLWGVLLLVMLIPGVVRNIVALVMGPALGADALRRQPDAITLTPQTTRVWDDDPSWSVALTTLRELGFQDAGVFSVAPHEGVQVRILAQPHDGFTANLYEHTKAGRWVELVTHFTDGTYASWSTMTPTGLAAREDCVRVQDPKAKLSDLYRRALQGRPAKTSEPVSVASAARDFERHYAEDMAWRKRKGISRVEMVKLANRRRAA